MHWYYWLGIAVIALIVIAAIVGWSDEYDYERMALIQLREREARRKGGQ